MSAALIKEMLEKAVHIGHKRQYWSPKMRNFIFGTQSHMHVFDLSKTIQKLEEVKSTLKDISEKGKTILFVGTKLQARDAILKIAKETGHLYVTNKWVPGLLTNFATIKQRIIAYNKLEKDLETGALDVLTKKEKSQQVKLLGDLRDAYEGVKDIRRLPDAVVVVDGHFEAIALKETATLNIPSFALLGSTGDIDSCTNFIPCNVNSIISIDYILSLLQPAITPLVKAEKKAPGVERLKSHEKPFAPKNTTPRTPRTENTKKTAE
jgi:small subunit ribosomal protein S2